MSHSEEKKLPLSELLYYQKPALGPSRSRSQMKQPLHVTFPSGAYGVALPSNSVAPAEEGLMTDSVVIASESENEEIDVRERKWITGAYLILAVVNIVISSLMYKDAVTVNQSNVVTNDDTSQLHLPFEVIPDTRRGVENSFFAFVIISIVVGSVSAILENAMGLSAYALSTVIAFLCGTAAQPYFVFSFRSIFDIWMLYLALVLRSKLLFNVLPLRIRAGW
jgi:hypothetical protein